MLPAPPAPASAAPFPLLATLAPVAVSILIWIVTRSPFALLFAGLGPAVAIASTVDGRLERARHARREQARHTRELEEAAEHVRALHAAERVERERSWPSAAVPAARLPSDPERWRHALDAPFPVRLGRAAGASSLLVEGTARDPGAERLVLAARAIEDVPLVVDARHGVGVAGRGPWARAVVRALIVQALCRARPDVVVRGELPETWFAELPHARASGEQGAVALEIEDRRVLLAWAPEPAALPRECRIVLAIGGAGAVGAVARLVRHPDRREETALVPDVLTEAEARRAARAAASAAAAEGWTSSAALPHAVRLGDLVQPPAAAPRGLPVAVGAGLQGAAIVDLVADGPHAIVAGTTGSGKSELLTTWIVALAARYGPDEATFLLVDFKGGATFAPLASLPHVAGVLTDLDESEAARALQSLRAELRRRERALALARVRSIEEGGGLARLVLVVDEFAVLADRFPDLLTLLADIAARGRSLGVHLVLCTQRPTGVVRETVLANAGLRIALRVTDATDSRTMLGTTAATELPLAPRGRAILARGGPGELVQVALADDATIALARAHAGAPAARPWLPPLPAIVPLAMLPPGPGVALGVRDLPEEQRQDVLRWDPLREGHVLVLGGPRSGRSGVLDAIAAGSPDCQRPAARAPELWDALEDALADLSRPAAAAPRRILLLDDVDATLGAVPDELEHVLAARLARVLREGPRAGVVAVVTAVRLPGALGALAPLFGPRLVLRMPTRQDHVLAGGDPSTYEPSAGPGAGRWEGVRVQIAAADRAPAPPGPRWRVVDGSDERGLAVVATASAVAARLRASAGAGRVVELGVDADPRRLEVATGGARRILVGTPEGWQAAWDALPVLARTMPVLFADCSEADVRLLARVREPLPPCPPGQRGWLLEPGGAIHRACLAPADGSRGRRAARQASTREGSA